MKKLIKILLLLSILIASCTNQDNAFRIQGVDIPLNKMNTALTIRDSTTMGNSYKNGDALFLQLVNSGDRRIELPDDFGIKIITRQGTNWTDVQNNWTYNYAGKGHTLLLFDEDPSGIVISMMPNLFEIKGATTIKVIVVGKFEASEELVGAYIDIPLLP